MKKKKKSILVLAIISAFVGTGIFLPGPVGAGDNRPPGPPTTGIMTMLNEIYDIVLDTNFKVGELSVPALVAKTGQTVTRSSGDDGDLQMGITWPDPRFTDNGDGTITDNLTGLIWTQNANLYGYSNWSDALSFCDNCSVGDYNDWRLPNVRELHSLVDYSMFYPALPADHLFDDVQAALNSYPYWSSTIEADCYNCVWLVNLGSGNIDGDRDYEDGFVWCVRGGQ